MNILLVEDDKTIATGLEYSLQSEGFTVTTCNTIKDAKQKRLNEFDLYILDLSLPDGSGYDICKLIKKSVNAPVIFLTACDDEVNVVMGLDMGADDYITKPFRIRELISRIHVALRHYQKTEYSLDTVSIDNITINTKQAKVFKDGEEVFLTSLEYRLLLTFVNHIGQVLTRNQLLEGIWDVDGSFINDNTLSVYIKRLREKLEDDSQNPKLLITVRGLGYRMGDKHDKK
ncbi:MAG: two-component response regulator [Anaerocolumna sp.]|jgi:DNA-binding response OmpR family regulator|nr:two-component response regulator [Anaerocolumna sp.]